MLRKSASAAISAAAATAARRLDHRPERRRERTRHRRERPRDRGLHCADVLGRLDHRQQDPQVAVAPEVERRAQLGVERAGMGEQQLEPALRRAGEERRRLVGAEVEHAHGRGATRRAR